ncbi:calexcitin-1-like [Hyposmocoma kahamanoa]|uniref:calexcitin-1-like n=1 Tax=Hyposmocoma kahamanoa TaxID=1477025 RepID=UPI000E6D7557|nr:calexcitin-1-like [Hyposmocoma kahamanoa]
MVSDFRKKKYTHVFYVFLDSDKSGSIERKDFALTATNIAKKRGYKAGETAYELIKEMLGKIWEGLIKDADANGDGVVTVDEWIKLWDEYAKNPAGAKEWQKLYAKCFFQLADVANDGTIDAEEFGTVCECFGLDKNESMESFKKLTGGKAQINFAEYEKLFQEYFTSDDVNAPGNNIFGKPK